MSYRTYHPEDDPIYDLRIAAQNYWCGQTGQEGPPDPSYRMVDGEMKLGRYMGPYECQMHLVSNQSLWRNWYTGFLTGSGIGVAFGGFSWIAMLILAPWYLLRRKGYREQYDSYYRIMQEIERTGQPKWVAYDKKRLDLIERDSMAVYP